MRVKKQHYLILVAFVVLILVAVASIVFARTSATLAVNSVQIIHKQTLPGQIAPSIKGLTPVRPTASGKMLNLSIGLNLRNVPALDALIAAQNNPNSPSYHHYLTPLQFEQSFAPTQASIQSLTAYLQSQGVQVTAVAPNRMLIDATSTVANAERAFNVTITDFSLHGRSVYSPTANPSVPDSLNAVISTIAGLDNVAHYHYNSQLKKATPHVAAAGAYTPANLRAAYDINPLLSSGANGTGQTVAIFELDGYQPSDINTYLSNYGLGSAKYSSVLIDGATNTPGPGAIEVELDMEVVSAIAPNAAQKIYIGPNNNTGVNDTYNQIVADDTAKVISTSWGQCEANSGASELIALDNIFKQAAAQGQAIFAASGDSGAYDCGTTSLAVDSPADDPNVVGVGGTTLNVASGGVYQSESAWSNSNGNGGGGGISSQFKRPGYQTGTNLTNANREVPDVSADADPNTGYSVYCTISVANCSGWLTVGGTSAAAPLWAASAADINQYLATLNQSTLGSASADIYKLYNASQTYSAYHDITTGSNLFYAASTGYDLATGIGSPDIWNVARDLAGATTGSGNSTGSSLANGGFEGGTLSWAQSSNGGYQLINSLYPHTGNQSAFLCGYSSCIDTLYQTVTLPATVTKATLSYWTYIDTQDRGSTACTDTLTARIRTVAGATIATVQTQCNTNTHGWTQYTFDVTASLVGYAGQKVEITFQGVTQATTSSDFYLDDVAFAG